MRRIKTKWSFVIGMLVGCLTTILAMFLWLWPAVSFKKPGEVVFTDYPKGINTVTFENDLVRIWVTDLSYRRDVPFELNFVATCKDEKYGQMWGMPYKDKFFFEYKNVSEDLFSAPPANDIQGTHPLSKMKKPNKSEQATPRKPSD